MLKKYKPFLRAGAIDTMAYRFNILVWAGITVCQVACLVFLWLAVYRSSEGGMNAEIHGFTYREMIAYVVLTTIFSFVTFNNDTLWNINNDIKNVLTGWENMETTVNLERGYVYSVVFSDLKSK